MEVFVAFSDLNDVPLLEETMEAWAESGAEPIGLQCKKKRTFELFRRIAADEKASDSVYILADIGCVLADPSDLGRLSLTDKEGMKGLTGSFRSEIPTGVRVLRRKAVKKWEPKITDSYDVEHVRSIKMAGMEVGIFHDIFYKRLLGHS